MAKRLTYYILGAMIAGIVVGITLNRTITDPATLTDVTGHISILTELFLRLIKMIIAPLVFATLVTGIAHMGDTAALGRVGFRSIAWFLTASLMSLTLGLIMVNLLQPGVGADLVLPPEGASAGVSQADFSLKQFVTHLVPKSFFEAMATNEILQIVVFSVFTGVAITAVGERAAPLVRGIEALVQVMLQITDYVMRFAPFAVFAAVTTALAEQGPGILLSFGKFMGSFYLSMFLLWGLLLLLCYLIVGGRSKLLIRYIREPILLAFSTASSEAAFPRTLEALDRFGVPPRIASFVLPLGYSFNLDGSMIYCTFATMFIAQAYGIELTFAHQVTMLLILMVTSKGIAGVPRASLVIISSTLAFFDIPEAGLLLILAVDHFLDMGRSATNVVGNAVASVIVAKWEGGRLDEIEPAEIEPPRAP
ncbi:cation:dicarboxylase symporter family transporter [Sphingomonas histidinilytica]|uniref:Na+/H+-dicarboxylate symporter n=1 Tax=Rhizorhabdus histidinilytica TaxID=439228 RepID=A0A1T5BV98_9SPHN|nr:dicarboxylate/amino acid:cation symporter [Rhizorhabdus histidinilytica]MBO9375174.1 cation:dicarboxylase symporter family transporter [Rhizorhabdus histidinilytica]QEH77444.1 dicarboxylate/amino acid:cation symporter [Sphingomonas sp. C8-2]SKB51009.1 Na+/H+-dicarboxylate symporter [Rhizorhabdus histidinilytica]